MSYFIYSILLLSGLVLGFLLSKLFRKDKKLGESKHRMWDVRIKAGSAFAALLILLSGLIQNQVENERNFRNTLYEDRYELYSEVLKVTSQLEALRIDDLHAQKTRDFHPLKKKFLSFYYGRMILIEDTEVQDAMVKLKNVLEEYEFKNAKHIEVTHRDVKMACISLAYACRNSLLKTTDVKLDELELKEL